MRRRDWTDAMGLKMSLFVVLFIAVAIAGCLWCALTGQFDHDTQTPELFEECTP